MKVIPQWVPAVLMVIGVSTVAPAVVLAEDSGEAEACYEKAQTQLGLNRCAGLEYRVADDELNQTYQAVLVKHADDETFLARLRDAQRAWIAFRDAEMEALFPHQDEPGYYGSVFPMCWAQQLASLTRERTAKLRRWLEGVQEGNVCSGSLPIRDQDS